MAKKLNYVEVTDKKAVGTKGNDVFDIKSSDTNVTITSASKGTTVHDNLIIIQ